MAEEPASNQVAKAFDRHKPERRRPEGPAEKRYVTAWALHERHRRFFPAKTLVNTRGNMPSTPKDAGRVVIHFFQEYVEIGVGLEITVFMPPGVAVGAV